MTDTQEHMVAHLAELRRHMGRKEIALAVNTTVMTVSRWSRGECCPRGPAWRKLEALFIEHGILKRELLDNSEAGIFSAWLTLKSQARKKLLAAMNAYESTE